MWRVLPASRGGVLETVQYRRDIIRHGNVDISICVVPFQSQPIEEGSLSVFHDSVNLSERI